MENLIQQKISADHLMFVSLKYTKTCGVMINLLEKWASIITDGTAILLQDAKKKKKLKIIPPSPVMRIMKAQEIFSKEEDVTKVLEVQDMFKKIDSLRKLRENEFRKNVTLRVFYKGKEIAVNLDKLKEYNEMIDRFVEFVKKYHSSKK